MELAAIHKDLTDRQKIPVSVADALVDIYRNGDPEVFGKAVNEFRVVSDEERAAAKGDSTETIKRGWFGTYHDDSQSIEISEKIAVMLEDPSRFRSEYPDTIDFINKKFGEASDGNIKTVAYHVMVHEMLHSATRTVDGKEKKIRIGDVRGAGRKQERINYEEGLTDLLATFHTADVLDQSMNVETILYAQQSQSISNVLSLRFGGNSDVAWSWIRQTHRSNTMLEDFESVVKEAYRDYKPAADLYSSAINSGNLRVLGSTALDIAWANYWRNYGEAVHDFPEWYTQGSWARSTDEKQRLYEYLWSPAWLAGHPEQEREKIWSQVKNY